MIFLIVSNTRTFARSEQLSHSHPRACRQCCLGCKQRNMPCLVIIEQNAVARIPANKIDSVIISKLCKLRVKFIYPFMSRFNITKNISVNSFIFTDKKISDAHTACKKQELLLRHKERSDCLLFKIRNKL